MDNKLLLGICVLVLLIVTNAEECPFKGLLTLDNDKGKDYAVVNPQFPGAYNFFSKTSKTSRWRFQNRIIFVLFIRCKQEVSYVSDYEGGANCSNLIWGTSCNAACPDDSAYSLKRSKDITIYTDSSDLVMASITLDEWTFPISLDSNGKPWKIESQTAEERKYFIGRYTNVVTATSSTGKSSSCKFVFTIKPLRCTVPQVDESTIEGAVPNKTYYVSNYSNYYEKKICKQGYGWKQKQNNKDFVEVKCVETSPGHTEWKNWNSRNCT
ncbi:Hypothetical predicted protein, partial [Mytilus galloprovincialis]